jgi:hypothetical protein
MMKIKSFLGFISFLLFVKLPESPDQPFPGNLHPEYTKPLFQKALLVSMFWSQAKRDTHKTAGISIKGLQTYLPFLFFNQ